MPPAKTKQAPSEQSSANGAARDGAKPAAPAPPPRLKERYRTEIAP